MHHDSDEVVWVLEGEFSFQIGDVTSQGGPGTCAFLPRRVPHAWKNCGTTTGRAIFLYTPANAGGYIEEMLEPPSSDAEREARLAAHHWEIVGTNPL
jgi:mannose-6-phosphate isomerase-like protein (cupin superfamily)